MLSECVGVGGPASRCGVSERAGDELQPAPSAPAATPAGPAPATAPVFTAQYEPPADTGVPSTRGAAAAGTKDELQLMLKELDTASRDVGLLSMNAKKTKALTNGKAFMELNVNVNIDFLNWKCMDKVLVPKSYPKKQTDCLMHVYYQWLPNLGTQRSTI
ncbi:unnamed protein product [Leptidea sinapis]|uniref:Uncharacterized protein n=1 Tax=Leptidea sinapis TaxID=189913 RepID=A0A5E4QI25_9NEOP|nr:unnamed protein product [Leptidea sinapis]